MSDTTAISWCDATWSPWEGCTKVSLGCDNCYAAGMNRWLRKGENWGPGAPRREYTDAHWQKPLRWNAKAQAEGRRLRVFPSVCDPFDNEVDPAWRARFFELIEDTPHIDWLLLTKRVGNWRALLSGACTYRLATVLANCSDPVRDAPYQWMRSWLDNNAPANVWLGATVVNQAEADRDVPKLLAINARVRFLSIEPMLGPIDVTSIRRGDGWTVDALRGVYSRHHDEGFDHPAACEEHGGGPLIDWVIAGGESGPKARPSHPEWFRSLRDQCAAAGMPFHFKQWGEWAPLEQHRGLGWRFGDPRTGFFDRDDWHHMGVASYGQHLLRVGKHSAGRLLDGVTHDGFPEVSDAPLFAELDSA